jgi:hypothetical protein
MNSKLIKIFFAFTLFLVSIHAYSQNDSLVYNRLTLGFTPSALFNSYSGIQFNLDARLTKKFKTTFETGYIFNSLYSDKASGYRIKFGIEFMVYQHKKAAFIMGINKILRTVNEERSNIVNHPENYTEKILFDRHKVLHGVQLSFGEIYKISDKIRYSFMLGIGLGNLDVADSKEFPRENRDFLNFGYSFPGNYFYPVFSSNIKFMYSILNEKP